MNKKQDGRVWKYAVWNPTVEHINRIDFEERYALLLVKTEFGYAAVFYSPVWELSATEVAKHKVKDRNLPYFCDERLAVMYYNRYVTLKGDGSVEISDQVPPF